MRLVRKCARIGLMVPCCALLGVGFVGVIGLGFVWLVLPPEEP